VLADLDQRDKPQWKPLAVILRKAGYFVVSVRVVKSRKHWHVVAVVRPVPKSIHELIALQLLLGSDTLREANNLRRAMGLAGMPRRLQSTLNVLYEGR
jgi:hypothetical protein